MSNYLFIKLYWPIYTASRIETSSRCNFMTVIIERDNYIRFYFKY